MNYSAFFTVLLLFIVNGSFAQTPHGYYITTQNDTIYGEVRSAEWGQIKFKADGKTSKLDPTAVYRVYDAEKDKLYGSSYIQNCIVRIEGADPKMYKISERLTRIYKPLFAEVLIDGEIVVYAFAQGGNISKAHIHSGNTDGLGRFTGVKLSVRKRDELLRTYALKRSTNEIVELKNTNLGLLFKMQRSKIKKDQSVFFADFPELLQEMDQQESISYDYMLECIKRYNEQREIMGEGLATYGTTIF